LQGSHYLKTAVFVRNERRLFFKRVCTRFVCLLGIVLTRLPVCISLALNYFQNKIIFSDNAKLLGRAIFKQIFRRGAIVQKGEDH